MKREIQTILLRAKRDVYNYLSGDSISKILGEGYDFAELQEYQPTDDIKHISWINSAKLNKIYTKKMYEQKELNIAICSLIDGRFIIGEKLNILSYVIALLSYSAYLQNDTLYPILFFGKESKIYPPTKEIESIEKSIRDISTLNPLGKRLDYSSIPQRLMSILEPKSLLFLIGDFLDDIDISILSQKHEIVAVIIRDRWEENPKASSSTQLINPQTNQPINKTLSKSAIKHYRKKLKEHDKKLLSHFDKFGVKYIKVYRIDEFLKNFNKNI